MLPKDVQSDTDKIAQWYVDNTNVGLSARSDLQYVAELAYQRGREDERKQRADQEKANLDLAEAIESRGKE